MDTLDALCYNKRYEYEESLVIFFVAAVLKSSFAEELTPQDKFYLEFFNYNNDANEQKLNEFIKAGADVNHIYRSDDGSETPLYFAVIKACYWGKFSSLNSFCLRTPI